MWHKRSVACGSGSRAATTPGRVPIYVATSGAMGAAEQPGLVLD